MTSVLSAIAADARRTNLARVQQIGAALRRAAGKGLDAEGWAAVERTAHQLAGSAGTFGFAGVSERARYLERFCAEAMLIAPDERALAAAQRVLDQASHQLADDPVLD